MAQAVEEDCALYIVNAGMSCYDTATFGRAGVPATEAARASLEAFAETVAPMMCRFINGFVNTTNGLWLTVIEAANKIIEAIKKALSDPRKLGLALDYMNELLDSIVEKIEQIAEFITEIPNEIEDLVTGQLNRALSDIRTFVNEQKDQAIAACEARKASIIAKLQAKYDDTGEQKYLDRIEEIQAKDCTDVIGIEIGDPIEWPEIPEFSLGLHLAINAAIRSFEIRLPEISIKSKFGDDGAKISEDAFRGKVEEALNWTNSKIDAINEGIKPFVESYNAIMEFIEVLASLDPKGVLEWLLSLPKKIIDTYTNLVDFALQLVQSIIDVDPMAILEEWAQEKFDSMLQSIRDRFEEQFPEDNRARNLYNNFMSEVTDFINTIKNAGSDIELELATHIELKTEEYGPGFGAVVEFACKVYGFLIGGISYCMSVIVAEADPLLSLIGVGSALFSPAVDNNINPNESDLRMPVNGSGSAYETFYKQEVGSIYAPLLQDSNGTYIPYNSDGSQVVPFPNGRYYVDPDRPILPFGYFAADVYGRQTFDDDGLPVRVNSDYTPNTVERPLIDPILAARLNDPDVTEWKRLIAVDNSIGDIRISRPEDQRLITVGTWDKTITHTLEFRGIELDLGIPQQEVSTVGSGIAPDLNSAGGGTTSNDFYGSFWYTRTMRITENVTGGYGLGLLGRDPGTFEFTLESTRGVYKYDKMGRGLVMRVTAQAIYEGITYDDWRDPLDTDKDRVFYYQAHGGFNYDNVGRIYVDNDGSYRFGLFDNHVSLVLRPQDDDYPWGDYNTPGAFEFDNSNTAELFDDMIGGKTFGNVQNLMIFSSLASGISSVSVTVPKGEERPISSRLFLKRPSNSNYIITNMLESDLGNWVAPISEINEVGEHKYYYELQYNDGRTGLSDNYTLTLR